MGACGEGRKAGIGRDMVTGLGKKYKEGPFKIRALLRSVYFYPEISRVSRIPERPCYANEINYWEKIHHYIDYVGSSVIC